MPGESYSTKEIRFATREVVEKQGGFFLLDTANHIDPLGKKLRLASGNTLAD